jgi:hypothetical protein
MRSTSKRQANANEEEEEHTEDNPIPTAASRWTKETLDLLNAKYDSHAATQFEFNDVTLPEDIEKGVFYVIDGY